MPEGITHVHLNDDTISFEHPELRLFSVQYRQRVPGRMMPIHISV